MLKTLRFDVTGTEVKITLVPATFLPRTPIKKTLVVEDTQLKFWNKKTCLLQFDSIITNNVETIKKATELFADNTLTVITEVRNVDFEILVTSDMANVVILYNSRNQAKIGLCTRFWNKLFNTLIKESINVER